MKNPYKEVIKQIVANAVSDRQAAAQTSDANKTQAYINYQNSLKNLNQGLASQGITGGGSESALLGASTGYQNTMNTLNSQRALNLSNIKRDATANQLTAETQSSEWENEQQAQKEQRFANTITGYNTVKACNNAIEKAKADGETWKIPYLRAQRAALQEQAKSFNSGVSGSSSSGSSVSSNNDDNKKKKTTTPNTQNGYYSNNSGSYYNNKTKKYGITGGNGGHYSY